MVIFFYLLLTVQAAQDPIPPLFVGYRGGRLIRTTSGPASALVGLQEITDRNIGVWFSRLVEQREHVPLHVHQPLGDNSPGWGR